MITIVQSATKQYCIEKGFNVIENIYAISGNNFVIVDPTNSSLFDLDCFMNSEPINHRFATSQSTKWKASIRYTNIDNFIVFDGITLILLDLYSVGYISHYFHFLEHLIPLYSILSFKQYNPDNVKNIIFPNSPETTAYGKNKMNSEILKLLFPKSVIWTEDNWSIHVNKNNIKILHAITSDRVTSHKANLSSTWNKMMVYI